MRILVKIIFILGIAFGGYGLIYSISILLLKNEVGNFFDMENAKDVKISIVRDSTLVNIEYSYKVEFQENYRLAVNYFEKCDVDTIIVKYNPIFPSISIIEGIPLIRRQMVGIVLSSIFILFLVLVWNLSDREKWYKRYGM